MLSRLRTAATDSDEIGVYPDGGNRGGESLRALEFEDILPHRAKVDPPAPINLGDVRGSFELLGGPIKIFIGHVDHEVRHLISKRCNHLRSRPA